MQEINKWQLHYSSYKLSAGNISVPIVLVQENQERRYYGR